MAVSIDESTCRLLAESLDGIESRRPTIAAAVARHMRSSGWQASGRADREERDAEALADALLSLTIAEVRNLTGGGRPRRLAEVDLEHRSSGIGSLDYLTFVEGLQQALRSAPGVSASPRTVRAWHDGFWAVIRAMRLEPDLLEP